MPTGRNILASSPARRVPRRAGSWRSRKRSPPGGPLFGQAHAGRASALAAAPSTLTDEQKAIGEIIIGNLGSSGYLRASVEEIAEMASTTPEAVQTVLERVQLFDPVGVAARDARECLLVQLKNLRYDRDPILMELVQSHLEDLEAHRYKPLLRKFKLDMEGLREYLDIIQSLEPLPGASFDSSEPTYVSPDVFVYSVGDEFVILLNEEGLPHLQLSSMLRDGVPSCNEKREGLRFGKKYVRPPGSSAVCTSGSGRCIKWWKASSSTSSPFSATASPSSRRSSSRISPTISGCTSPRSAASPLTNMWRRRTASSSSNFSSTAGLNWTMEVR